VTRVAFACACAIAIACEKPAWHVGAPPREDEARAMARVEERAALEREQAFYEALHPGAREGARSSALAAGGFAEFATEGEALFALDAPWHGGDAKPVRPLHAKGAATADATRCAGCHHVGGIAGAGSFADIAFFDSDGDDVTTAARRLPPMLAGAALLELAAENHPERHPFGWAPGRPRRLREMVAWSIATHLGETPRDDEVDAIVAFIASVAPPVRTRAARDALVMRAQHGEELFRELGCASCHVESLPVGDPSLRLADGRRLDLSAQLSTDGRAPYAVRAYSDLRAHDMGPELGVFVTAPLWGVASRGPYMHDGRAQTIHEAILAHGGEAEGSRKAFTLRRNELRDLDVFFVELTRTPTLAWAR
jgi:hypothetical protein